MELDSFGNISNRAMLKRFTPLRGVIKGKTKPRLNASCRSSKLLRCRTNAPS